MSQVYKSKVREDVDVEASIGFGCGSVRLTMSPGDMAWTCDLDAEAARDLGLALMDAANAIDSRLSKKRETGS